MKKKMQKILAVVGPTSTGKTDFALKLAIQALQLPKNYTGVDLISVDSRQVYKGLEILSGADIPKNFNLVANNFPYYNHKQLPITIHGVSIIEFDQEWSVTHFKSFATSIILHSFENNRLPILVGGTGLYYQHLFNSDEDLYIPPNKDVRRKAEKLSVQELSEWLFTIDPEALVRMNDSDVDNPRRLVRAIEKAVWNKKYFIPEKNTDAKNKHRSQGKVLSAEITTFGMQTSLEIIQAKIKLRVQERFERSAVEEVKKMQKKCRDTNLPVCSTLGVADILEYLSGNIDKNECKKNWALHEFQYAKRQITWFSKNPDIIWLDDLQKKQYTLR